MINWVAKTVMLVSLFAVLQCINANADMFTNHTLVQPAVVNVNNSMLMILSEQGPANGPTMTMEAFCKSTNMSLFNRCARSMLNFERRVPIHWALPIYGYAIPILILITAMTNSFVVTVLRHRDMHSPTNYVLMVMSISELATGVSTLPWVLYYYTFQGYEGYRDYGMSWFWCHSSIYFGNHIPSYFHTASCWLTVYLAIQRYIYICQPRHVARFCTVHAAHKVFVGICVADLIYHLPTVLSSATLFTTAHPQNPLYRNLTLPYEGARRVCLAMPSELVDAIGRNVYYNALFWFQCLSAHVIPSALLIGFTYRLMVAMKRADERYSALKSTRTSIAVGQLMAARSSVAGTESTCVIEPARRNTAAAVFNGELHTAALARLRKMKRNAASQHPAGCSVTDLRNNNNTDNNRNGSVSEARRLTATSVAIRSVGGGGNRISSMKQNTRMLVLIITLFLVVELPAAALKILHALIVTLKLNIDMNHYKTINILLVLRNVALIFMYPVRLVIYCSMSVQFRTVAQGLFPVKLFVTTGRNADRAADVEPGRNGVDGVRLLDRRVENSVAVGQGGHNNNDIRGSLQTLARPAPQTRTSSIR